MVETLAATFLFTDLVGSTALASSLPPPEREALRQRHFSLLRHAISENGGTEVKNLGDGVMAMFPAASRAVACAVAIQQAIEHRNRMARPKLLVRIGLSVGEVIEDGGDYFGDAVIEAARLCAHASGAQILATSLVQLSLGRNTAWEFTDVGGLELKGLPGTVQTVEVVWAPADTSEHAAMGLPQRLAVAATAPGFVGREAQLSTLLELFKAADTASALQVALIAGEPGIGKTSLAAKFAATVNDRGAAVVHGGCLEGIGAPYEPWVQALTPLVVSTPDDVLARLIPAHGAALGRLLPEAADRLPAGTPVSSDADGERLVRLQAVGALLGACSRAVPLLVVLDDLHWADAATLQLLRHLVATAQRMRMLLVGTYRSADLGRAHPLSAVLADLRREPSVTRLDLPGLSDLDMVDLVASTAAGDAAASGDLATLLYHETDGNPFFAKELLAHLGETGQLSPTRPAVVGELDLPGSVREVIGERVARLGEDSARVLAAAAVIGRDFDVRVLAAATEAAEDDIFDTLDAARTAGLVVDGEEPGAYRFVHALVQHALYSDLSAGRRQRWHRRVAEALEAMGDDTVWIAPLAHHWLAATRPADGDKAMLYAWRAGDVALSDLAPADAAGWYAHALEVLAHQPSADDRSHCELLLRLAQAQARAGLPEHYETAKRAGVIARRTGDAELLVRAALTRRPSELGFQAADPDRLEVLEAALVAVGTEDSATRAHLLASLADEVDPMDWRRREDLAASAGAMARRVGDPATTVAVLSLTYSMGGLEAHRRREEDTATALGLAEHVNDPMLIGIATWFRAVVRIIDGDIGEFEQLRGDLHAVADRTQLPFVQAQAMLLDELAFILAGELDAAEAALPGWQELGAMAGFWFTAPATAHYLYRVRIDQGRAPEVIGLLTEAVAAYPSMPLFRCLLANACSAAGDFAAARRAIAPVATSGFELLPRDTNRFLGLVVAADVAADLRDTVAAAALHGLLAPFAGLVATDNVTSEGCVARPLGRLEALLGDVEAAIAHFEQALAVNQRIGTPYWSARTQLELADLVRDREPSRASELAAAALGLARIHGYKQLERDGRRALSQSGVAPLD
jgi:class 3 adenylate cyclase/tetratricopeptide (TPR) repeat protein